jgi:hypothetical protein
MLMVDFWMVYDDRAHEFALIHSRRLQRLPIDELFRSREPIQETLALQQRRIVTVEEYHGGFFVKKAVLVLAAFFIDRRGSGHETGI